MVGKGSRKIHTAGYAQRTTALVNLGKLAFSFLFLRQAEIYRAFRNSIEQKRTPPEREEGRGAVLNPKSEHLHEVHPGIDAKTVNNKG